jgi:hypothetical protein
LKKEDIFLQNQQSAICFEKYLLKKALFVADNQRVGYFCRNSNTKILKYGNRSVNVRGRR